MYDLYVRDANPGLPVSPWQVTVHFQGFPADKLLRCSTFENSKELYFHSLKQSLYLLHGSTRIFNSLSQETQMQIWDATCTGARGLYEQAVQVLRPSKESTRHIPIRVLFKHQSTSQKPTFVKLDGENTTLWDALRDHIPGVQREALENGLVVQGIVVSLDTPVNELWALFAHADMFLYICCLTL